MKRRIDDGMIEWVRAGRSGVAIVLMSAVMSGSAWAAEASDTSGAGASAEAAETASEGAPVGDTPAGTGQSSGEAKVDGQKSDRERITVLEGQVGVLASELSKAFADESLPEEKLKGVWGFGPAASKVYRKDHGLSIGGYGEVRVRTFVSENNAGKVPDTVADALRAVLYVGYKFSDKWVVNSELEFEHASSSGGSVSVEFLNVDYMALENHGIRAGLLLVPMGFVNEIHEPTFFYGAERPEVERQIIPSTWREVGGGVFGQFFDSRLSYRIYGINGFKATGFNSSGLRGGRQKGSRAVANDWAVVARADLTVVDGLVFGGSVYAGNSGQDQTVAASNMAVPDTFTTIYELHAEYKAHGLSLRALFTQAFLADTGALNAALQNPANNAVASAMLGAYGEIAYDVLPLVFSDTRASLEPFFRYSRLDTQNQMTAGYVANGNFVRGIYTVGLQFKPIANVVFKVDYRNTTAEVGAVADEVQFGVGYVF